MSNDIPAFPINDAYAMGTEQGMTLRDYFAAKAMQAFTRNVGWRADQGVFEEIAQGTYRQADAMMKARG
jgi:hypothetical protein